MNCYGRRDEGPPVVLSPQALRSWPPAVVIALLRQGVVDGVVGIVKNVSELGPHPPVHHGPR